MEESKGSQIINHRFIYRTWRAMDITSRIHKVRALVRNKRSKVKFSNTSWVVTVFIVLLPWGARSQGVSLPLPPGASSAIEKVIPGASVVTLDDIDGKGCNPVPHSPGVVTADFNGDNHPGFAVLLKGVETGKTVEWQGQKLKEVHYAFAIFLSDGENSFRAGFVRRFVDFSPIGAYIEIQPPGSLRNRDENRDVLISNPGVALVFCEKSAAVYYVSRNHIRRIPIVD
jgi:hypothetical protein